MENIDRSRLMMRYPRLYLVHADGLSYDKDVGVNYDFHNMPKIRVDLDDWERAAEVANNGILYYEMVYERAEEYPILDKHNILELVKGTKAVGKVLDALKSKRASIKTTPEEYLKKIEARVLKVDYTEYNKGVTELRSKMQFAKNVTMMIVCNGVRTYVELTNRSVGIEQAIINCITESGFEPESLEEFVKNNIIDKL